jgi:hypothetical protein
MSLTAHQSTLGSRLRAWRKPGWPVGLLFAGFPLLWALGLGALIYPLLAIPMVVELRRRGKVRVPSGFGWWALFLLWVVLGFLLLDLHAPETLRGEAGSRIIAYVYRLSIYLAATVLLLYVGNLKEQELPTQRVIKWLSWLFITTIVGGYLGLLLPRGGFPSPVELLLPGPLADVKFVTDLTHPGFAQVQTVLGAADARPKAPYVYTNEWGANCAYLLPFFVHHWLIVGTRQRRRVGAAILAAAIVPIVFSLNRGLWICIVITAVYVAVRIAAQRPRLIPHFVVAGVVAAVLFAMSPLAGIVTARADSEHSTVTRGFLVQRAIDGAIASPVLGWGSPRQPVGNARSATLGKSDRCPNCGTPNIGTHGQLWLVLYTQGIVGAALFVAFFVTVLRRSLRDPSTYGVLFSLVIVLWFVQMFIYPGLPMSIHIVMTAIALSWRRGDGPGRLSRLGIRRSPEAAGA